MTGVLSFISNIYSKSHINYLDTLRCGGSIAFLRNKNLLTIYTRTNEIPLNLSHFLSHEQKLMVFVNVLLYIRNNNVNIFHILVFSFPFLSFFSLRKYTFFHIYAGKNIIYGNCNVFSTFIGTEINKS